jgi:hypothetical protein
MRRTITLSLLFALAAGAVCALRSQKAMDLDAAQDRSSGLFILGDVFLTSH